MMALGQTGEARAQTDGDEKTASAPTESHLRLVPPPTPANPPATLTIRGRFALAWTLWMGLVLAGFFWQFVNLGAGFLNR